MGWLFRGAVALAAIASPALAATATFDDLATDTLSHGVPTGYVGLNWDHFFYQQASAVSGGSGFANGLVSGAYVAYSDSFEPVASISSASAAAFTFNSAYLTAARTDGLQIDVAGFNGVTPLFDRIVTVNTAGPSHLVLDWSGVTSVVFTYQGLLDSGNNFVVDDLVVNGSTDPTAAPLPAAAFPALALLAAVAVARRCRRSTSSSPTG